MAPGSSFAFFMRNEYRALLFQYRDTFWITVCFQFLARANTNYRSAELNSPSGIQVSFAISLIVLYIRSRSLTPQKPASSANYEVTLHEDGP
jgi:hypothetical protein